MKEKINKKIRYVSNKNSLIILIFLSITVSFAFILKKIENLLASNLMISYEMFFLIAIQYLGAIPLSITIVNLLFKKHDVPKLKKIFCKPKTSIKEITKWIVISLFMIYSMSYLSNFLFSLIQFVTNIKLNTVSFIAEDSVKGIIFNVFFMVLTAPICEEILFRGTMTLNFSEYGSWSAVISTGILFGLYHMNYQQLLYTTMLGFCASFLFIKTQSIIPSICLHLLFNTIGLIQSIALIKVDLEKLTNGDSDYIISNISTLIPIIAVTTLIIIIMIVGLIVFVLEIQKAKDQFQLENKYPEISELRKIKFYFSTPLTIITVIILVVLTIVNAIV